MDSVLGAGAGLFERIAVAFSALHLTSASDIRKSRHNADPDDVRERKIEVNTKSGNALKWLGRGFGGLGAGLTFHDELTRDTEVEVSTEERLADASVITGTGFLSAAGVAATWGGAAACGISLVCGAFVLGGGALAAGFTAYGLHENDGWLTDDHEDEMLMAPGPLPGTPGYDQYADPCASGSRT